MTKLLKNEDTPALPITKPSRSLSKGRLAFTGSFRKLNARIAEKPAAEREIVASQPPAKKMSASPNLIIRQASPIELPAGARSDNRWASQTELLRNVRASSVPIIPVIPRRNARWALLNQPAVDRSMLLCHRCLSMDTRTGRDRSVPNQRYLPTPSSKQQRELHEAFRTLQGFRVPKIRCRVETHDLAGNLAGIALGFERRKPANAAHACHGISPEFLRSQPVRSDDTDPGNNHTTILWNSTR
jgi:hypothetical protein